jgi:hypothetical protein
MGGVSREDSSSAESAKGPVWLMNAFTIASATFYFLRERMCEPA